MASEVKTAKNSKLPKLPEKCFEPVGKGGWPLISTWITSVMGFDRCRAIIGCGMHVVGWYGR
jgi:hypothetical protein